MADSKTVADAQLYAEDFAPGLKFHGEPVVLSLQHFSGFAALTGDAHPIHYDEGYAARTRFKRPIAHGLLLMAFTALGATAMSRRLEESMVALVEQGARFLRPAFVGDRVQAEFTTDAVDMKPGKGAAIVRFAVRLLDERQEPLLEGHHTYLIRSRRSVEASPAHRRSET
jgi:3-hydroxybutyryl-CoA dehydratase